MMTGLQTSRQQVGKRHIPKVGRPPGMLGLANRCPSRATVAMSALPSEERMCERKWEKQGGSAKKKGKKILMGVCDENVSYTHGPYMQIPLVVIPKKIQRFGLYLLSCQRWYHRHITKLKKSHSPVDPNKIPQCQIYGMQFFLPFAVRGTCPQI